MNKTNKKIVTDSSFLLVSDVLIKLKGIIFFPIIISKVGLENYGIIVQVLINPGIIAALFSLSLGSNFLRFTSKYSNKNRHQIARDFFTVISFSFILSLIGALVLFLLSTPISEYILSGKSEDIIKLSSLIVINEVIWRNLGFFLKCRKKFKSFSILALLYQLLPYLGFVSGILLYSDIFKGLQLFVFIQTLLNIIIFISIVNKLDFVFPSFSRFKKFVGFSWSLSLSNISGGLLSKSDRYFIGYFLGPSAIGLYSLLYMILSFIDQITVPFRNYIGTYLPKIWDNSNKYKALEQIRIGIMMYLSVAFYLFAMAVLYMKDFLLFISDLDFNDVENYLFTVISIALGVTFLGLTRFYFQIIQLSRQNHFYLVIQLIGLIFNISLNIVLMPTLGLLAAGIATFIGYFSIFIMSHFYFRIPFKPKVLFLQTVVIAICFLITQITVITSSTDNTLLFLLSIVVSTIIFFVFLYFLLNLFKVNEIFKLKDV